MKDYTVVNPVFSDKISIVEEDDLVNAENDTAAAKQLIENDLALALRVNNALGYDDNGEPPSFAEGLDAKNVIDAINKLFTQGNENKQTLVDNLIAMGIQASTDDTWGTLLDKVLDMTDTSNDTVTAATLLAGYTAHNASGELITGIMPNKGAWTANTTGNGNVPIPAGHHNGQGYVSGAGAYAKGMVDADARTNTNSANYKNGYNAGVTATKKGTAGAGDVLAGKTFTNTGSVGASGTMPNRGAWTANTTGNSNVTIPAGYHNGSGYVSGAGAYNKGVSDADGRPNVNSANYKAGYNQGYEAGKSAGNCTILRFNAGTLEGNSSSHRSDFNVDCTGKSRVEFDYCGYANSASLQLDVYVGNNFNNNANADWYGNPWEWSDATKIATIDASGNSVRHASINIPNGKKWLSFYITNNHNQYAGVEIRNFRMT